jgi:hypothetical protein
MLKTKVRTVGDLRKLLKGLPADTKLVACWPRGQLTERYDPDVELSDVFSDTRRKFLCVVVRLVPYET